MNLSTRSYQKELLDADQIPTPDLHRNLYELNLINTLLGGHAVTLSAFENLKLKKDTHYRVLDIGCGGGDTLMAIAEWARARGLTFELTGVDLKEDCISYATAFCKGFPEINFVQSDYRDLLHRDPQYDIIVTSLFCHHLHEEEVTGLFKWCKANARVAVIMNDLHRHPLAYRSIEALTKFFSRSYLVKNDAKLSVARGFSRAELESCAAGAGMNNVSITWKWAFRWLLVSVA